MTQLHPTHLDTPPTLPHQLISSADLRCTLTHPIKTLLQPNDRTIPQPTPNPETFLNSLKTNPNIYQASLSRQFAADLPPDIEQTTLKDEPKDWYIKTADFGDECDRPLQHRDGEYTQLLEDLATYHQILQNHCDRIIVLRPHNYGGYDVLLNSAMRCLGYSPAQFQYITIQPIKLYAFHRDSNQTHSIPDLPFSELQKAVTLDTIHWYNLRVPLRDIASLNLSTSSPNHPQNHFHRIQLAYTYSHKYLKLLETHNLQVLSETTTSNPQEHTLLEILQQTPSILDRAIQEVAPHLICQHVEKISEQCLQWLPPQQWQATSHATLQKICNTISDLVETKLGLTLIPNENQQKVTA